MILEQDIKCPVIMFVIIPAFAEEIEFTMPLANANNTTGHLDAGCCIRK